MPLEVKGRHLRVRVRRTRKGAKYRTDDVGAKGHTKRVAMKPKGERWITQSWLFPVKDVLKKRKKTMKILSRLGVVRKARKLIKKVI